jgi:nucleotide-binding universal stress UspA family protein
MKKILVPFDFSGPAVQAFRFASDFALLNDAVVYVLHVSEFPVLHHPLGVPVNTYEDSFLRNIRVKAKTNFDKISDKWAGKLKPQFFVEHGFIINAIRDFTLKKKIDLIVMGSHGSTGFREYAIGSNAEKVVQTSKVPVVVVKKAVPVSSIKNLVFPTNFSKPTPELLTSIQGLQKLFKAKMHVLFVNTPARFMRNLTVEKRLKEFVNQYQLKNVTINIFSDIDEEEGIINFSSGIKDKMIVMSTHGRKGLNHLFTGSIAEDVVNHIDCPVWTSTQ